MDDVIAAWRRARHEDLHPDDRRKPDYEARVFVEERLLAQHYERWLDEPEPRLGGRSPRQAAREPAHRPDVTRLVLELEERYHRNLITGVPVHDPTWMWDDLGLQPPASSRRAPHDPQLGHEALEQEMPGLTSLALYVAENIRREHGGPRLAEVHDFRPEPAIRWFQREYGDKDIMFSTGTSEDVLSAVEAVASFELYGRRAFRVPGALAWMLGATPVEVPRSALRLPFESFALVFADDYALGLAERAFARFSPKYPVGMFKTVTVYVSEPPPDDDLHFVWMFIMCERCDGLGVELIEHMLGTQPQTPLEDAITPPWQAWLPHSLEPSSVVGAPAELERLIVATILYMTSAGIAPLERGGDSAAMQVLPGPADDAVARRIRTARRGGAEAERWRQRLVLGRWEPEATQTSGAETVLRWAAPYTGPARRPDTP